jgi:basic amino acid/polyamine antiporter, APA family
MTQHKIQPKLAAFDLSMIIISLVIGIGIFRAPALVAKHASNPQVFFLAWILGGLVSIFGALIFAEIGSRYHVAGGFYRIFSHCYHPAFAFMLNWSLVITNAASSIGVAVVGAEYINPVILPSNWQGRNAEMLTATIIVSILYALNMLGIKSGKRTQNVLSGLKIFMLIIFCSAAYFGTDHTSPMPSMSDTSLWTMIASLGMCFITIFFSYGGYQNTINFGADIKEPQRNIPKAIFIGITVVVIIYLLINLAFFKVLGFEGLRASKLPAADLARVFFGRKGAALTSIAIFISVLGFINTSMMSNPRIYFAMAEDKLLPAIFGRLNQRTMVQEFSLSFFLVLMIISMLMLQGIEKIINYVMFIDSISLAFAAGTIFIFRARAKKEKKQHDKHIYQIAAYPIIPILFIAVLTAVTASVLFSDPLAAAKGAGVFILGWPIYWLMGKVNGKGMLKS